VAQRNAPNIRFRHAAELLTDFFKFLYCYIQRYICNKTIINIGVIGAQSTFGGGGKKFLPEKYVCKINKMPEFYTILD